MATRTGAPYLHLEGSYCSEDDGGCGQFLSEAVLGPDSFPPTAEDGCPNCGFKPLSHVAMTTADNIAD